MTGRLDPVTLSVLSAALSGIAEEMGAALIRSAYSSNIKERRDCSSALFDAHGRMVAQAEHIHLPDITVVTPCVHDNDIIGYAIARAHHSDKGDMRAGSMPSDWREIFQEGLVLPPIRLVRGGEPVDDVMKLLLANVRTPEIRRGDLWAQLAANELDGRRLGDLVERRGLDVITRAFDEVIAYTERRARSRIGDGPSAVHVGMSNTLNTPIEALELEYPLRVERQQLAVGSGGTGKHRGGDGFERSVRVLEHASVSLLTDRRRHAPKGAHGGEDGAPGENKLNGETLRSKIDAEVNEGDVISITTPGGGGWGS